MRVTFILKDMMFYGVFDENNTLPTVSLETLLKDKTLVNVPEIAYALEEALNQDQDISDFLNCENAAYNGHLAVLKWLLSNGWSICENVAIIAAASRGHVDVLEWIWTIYGISLTGRELLNVSTDTTVIEWVRRRVAYQ